MKPDTIKIAVIRPGEDGVPVGASEEVGENDPLYWLLWGTRCPHRFPGAVFGVTVKADGVNEHWSKPLHCHDCCFVVGRHEKRGRTADELATSWSAREDK